MAHRKATRIAVLKAARELIEDPKHWIKGKMVSANGKRYCAAGAIEQIDGPAKEEVLMDLALTVNPKTQRKYKNASIFRFNDARNRKHAEVLEAFDKTIERLGG